MSNPAREYLRQQKSTDLLKDMQKEYDARLDRDNLVHICVFAFLISAIAGAVFFAVAELGAK